MSKPVAVPTGPGMLEDDCPEPRGSGVLPRCVPTREAGETLWKTTQEQREEALSFP